MLPHCNAVLQIKIIKQKKMKQKSVFTILFSSEKLCHDIFGQSISILSIVRFKRQTLVMVRIYNRII